MVEFARTQKQGVEDQDTPFRVEPLDHDYELSQDLRAQHAAMGARQAWEQTAAAVTANPHIKRGEHVRLGEQRGHPLGVVLDVCRSHAEPRGANARSVVSRE
jgi:hypothetical protein